MAIQNVSGSDLEKKIEANHPVVVLYSQERDADLKMSRILGRIAESRQNELEFCVINLNRNEEVAQRHGVSATPIIRLFIQGKPVAQLAGVQSRDDIIREMDSVLSRPVEELQPLEQEELKVRVQGGEWGNAITSGIVAGIVLGFALQYLKGALMLMVPAAAIGFFIFSSNFRFSWEQKALAIAVMLAIGFFGENFLRWAFAG